MSAAQATIKKPCALLAIARAINVLAATDTLIGSPKEISQKLSSAVKGAEADSF